VVRRQNAFAAIAGVAAFGVSHVPLLTKDAQLGTSYFNAAGAAQAQGHYEAAAQYYELARKAGRRQPATELNYGALLNQLGRYEDALRAFAEAEREGGDAALIAENRAHSFLGLGKADAALEQIRKAEKQTTGSAELENFRGVVLQKLERNAEAEEAFRNALQQKPGYTFAYIHLIQQLAKAGDTTGVQALMRQAEISGADMKLLRDAAKPNHE
jgi:tetratricopeptide (TPR) repeat protein